MAVCTNTEVYNFMGTASDLQTTERSAQLTVLIANCTEEFKRITGRSAELIDHSSVAKAFSSGINCDIFGKNLYLGSFWRDWYEITEVKEDGGVLTEIISAATQNNDYMADPVVGKIMRPWAAWLDIPGTIEIKGRFGLITREGAGTIQSPYTYPTRPDVKQIIIEMVAAQSGIWKQTIMTDAGSVESVRTRINAETQKLLDGYLLSAV